MSDWRSEWHGFTSRSKHRDAMEVMKTRRLMRLGMLIREAVITSLRGPPGVAAGRGGQSRSHEPA